MKRIFPGLVFGASLLVGGVASAEAPFIASFEAHDDMFGGALWRNDRPNNNNQRGAGVEHPAIVRVGDNILIVGTASYTNVTPLIPGAGLSSLEAGIKLPNDASPTDGIGVQATGTRVEGLCASYKLDPALGLVKTNMAYFTNNDSPDWQNAHKMTAVSINGGNAALIAYGHDPNGNRTRVYAKVLGPNCELLSAQTQMFADNNDDYGGTKFAGVFEDSATTARACGNFIGNGNGTDDAHAFCITATKTNGTGAATYTVKPDFEISIEPNEERSRAYGMKTALPNMMVSCWAAGNTQPPNKGLRCGMINTAAGVPNGERLVWRQYVKQREGNIMYSTPALAPLANADGTPGNLSILSYVMVDTTNRNGRNKGRTTIFTVPVEFSATGLTMLDEPKKGLFGLSDGAHPGMTSGVYGLDKRPAAFLWSGNITDGGTATVKILGVDSTNKLQPIRALNWAAASSGGYTSLWYGHNPNTPQGRSYPVESIVVDNVGYGTGYQPTVKSFLVAVNTNHKDHSGGCTPDPAKGTNNGTCGGKNAFSLSLIPIAADAAQPGDPTDPNDPTPQDPTDDENNGNDTGESLGGCSSSGAGSLGSLMVFGLGAILIRRRRR